MTTDANHTPPPVDPERLAALIEGKLAPAERDALLAQLATSEEMREVLADVMATSQSSAEEDADVDALERIRRRRKLGRIAVWGAALAAAVVVLVVAPRRLRSTRGAMAPDMSVLRDIGEDRGLDEAVRLRAQSSLRGAPATPADRQPLAIAIGMRLASIEALATRTDSGAMATTHQMAREASVLAREVSGGALVGRLLDSLATNAADRHSLAPRAMASAEALFGDFPVRTGWWLETIRLAAAEDRVDVLQRSSVRRAVSAIGENEGIPESARREAERLAELLGRQPAPVSAVESSLTALLRELGVS